MSISPISSAPVLALTRSHAAPSAPTTNGNVNQLAAQNAQVKDSDGDHDSSPSSPTASSSSAVLSALSALKSGG
jgi:hypothetical protein